MDARPAGKTTNKGEKDMKMKLRSRLSLLFLSFALVLALPAMALAAELVTAELAGATNRVTVEQGKSASFNIDLKAEGAISCQITQANASTAKVKDSFSITKASAANSNTAQRVLTGSAFSAANKFWNDGSKCRSDKNSPVTWTGAPNGYSVPGTVSVDADVPVGTYTINLSPGNGTSEITNPTIADNAGAKLEDTKGTTLTFEVVAPPPPSDTTAPVIDSNIQGVLGENGWYRSDVLLSWTVVDNESAISSKNGCDNVSVTTDQNETTYTCTAKSAGGTTTKSVTIKRDATAPTNVQFVDGPAADSSHPFGSVPAAPTCSADGALSGLKDCNVTGYGNAVGSHTLTATATDNAGNQATATRSYTVTRANQAALTVDSPDSGTYGENLTINTSGGTTGGALSYEASGTACRIDASNKLEITDGTGTCSVKATMAGNTNYNDVTSQPKSVAVSKRAVTVKADAKSKTYGASDPGLTYQVTEGSTVNGDAFTGALSRAQGDNAGSYAIQQDTLALPSSKYTLRYVGANLTIDQKQLSVNAKNQSTVYGDSNLAPRHELSGFVNGESENTAGITGAPVCTIASSAGTNVGAYNDVIECAAGNLSSTNYSFAAGTKGNLTITARPITVTADAGQSKVYGQNDPALTFQVGGLGLAQGDSFSGALGRDAGENVGSYAINQGTLAANANYDLTFVGKSFEITRKQLTVTAQNADKIYGEANPAFHVVYDGFVRGDNASTLGGGLGFDTEATVASPVGNYDVTPKGLTSGNYDIVFVKNTLKVQKRPITVTADAGQGKVYGQNDPALGYQITTGSLVDGDSFSGALGRDAGENVGSYAINQGTLTAGGNYNLTVAVAGANFRIDARPITVTADAAQSKIYGQADPTLGYQVTTGSLVAGDSLSGGLSREQGQDVGTYAIRQGTLGNSNYDVTFIGANFRIDARPITVTADPQSKVYGQGDPNLTYQITSGNLVGTDGFNGGLSREQGQDVGSYPIRQATLSAGGNYELTFRGADLTITPATLTVKADDANRQYGDPNPSFTANITGFKLNDAQNTVVSGSPNLGTAATQQSPVGAHDITAAQGSLAANSNYTFAFQNGTLRVTAAPLKVDVQSEVREFGDPNPAFTGTIVGIKNGDNITASYSTIATASSPVDVYDITATLSDPQGKLGNYNVTINKGTLTIRAWTFAGFYAPVDNSTATTLVYNTVKGGSTVPLKFEVFKGSSAQLTELTDAAIIKPLTAAKVSCVSGAEEAPVEVTTTGSTSLRYDTTAGQFIYNWKSPTTLGCYKVTVTTNDAKTAKTAYFRIR